tara:strand:+ start:131 stop:301 length:171 start_codon:yes stop_codon:yes gene_type:complete
VVKNKYNLVLLGKPREITEGEAIGLHRENGFKLPFTQFLDELELLGFEILKRKSRK